MLRFFAKPITRQIDAWNNKTPQEQWYYYYDVLSFIARTCLQLHCVFEDKPIGPLGYVPGFFCFLNIFLQIFTTYFYVKTGDFINCLPSYCMLGLVTSVSDTSNALDTSLSRKLIHLKLLLFDLIFLSIYLLDKFMKTYSAYWSAVLKSQLWPNLIYPPSKIYRNNKELTAYNRICWECLKDSAKQYLICTSVTLLTLIGVTIGPVYSYSKGGRMATVYELRIPFFTDDPNTEIIINFVWQGLISCFGTLGLALIESAMALVNNTITVSSKLNVLSLQELSNQLEFHRIEGRESQERLNSIIKDIIYWDEYLDNFKKVLYWRMFLAPPTFTFSIAVSIYSQSVLDYPAGFGLAIACYIQMAILCYTGQNAISRVERLIRAIDDFKWYILPTESQKDIMSIMLYLQNSRGPTIGPFQPLSYVTFKNLTQRIYTFLMFLSNFEA